MMIYDTVHYHIKQSLLPSDISYNWYRSVMGLDSFFSFLKNIGKVGRPNLEKLFSWHFLIILMNSLHPRLVRSSYFTVLSSFELSWRGSANIFCWRDTLYWITKKKRIFLGYPFYWPSWNPPWIFLPGHCPLG